MGKIVSIFITAVGAILVLIGVLIIAKDQNTAIFLIAIGVAQALTGMYLLDLMEKLEVQIRRSYHSTAFLKLIAYNSVDKPKDLIRILENDPSILTKSEIDILEDCFGELRKKPNVNETASSEEAQ